MDQLLFDLEGSSGVLNCPLLLIQVHVMVVNFQHLYAFVNPSF
jgi:hypothetical protein